MSEQAGIWLRVSDEGQDEDSQWPDNVKHASEHGYHVAKKYTVHGKSAYHAEHDPAWREVVADVRSGLISVVIIWKVDRLDRGNILHAVPMVNSVLAAGGRVEFSTQPYIDLTTMPGRMAFGNLCEMAHEESRIKSDRVNSTNSAIDAAGGFRGGRPPWGYVSVCGVCGQPRCSDKAHRRTKYIGTDLEVRPVIVELFQRVCAGQSVPVIGEWLASLGYVKNNSSLAGTIRRAVYWNGRFEVTDHKGITRVHQVDPLVTPDVWQMANSLLDGRSSTNAHPRRPRQDDFSGRLYCSDGHLLYRNWNGSRLLDDNGQKIRTRVYYCRTCKVTWDGSAVDAEVNRFMSSDTAPEWAMTVIPGSDNSAAVQRIDDELTELPRRGLEDEQEDAERSRLRAEKRL